MPWPVSAISKHILAVPSSLAGVAGKHVLLVEDNDLNREIAEYILEESGMKITSAVNGQEAVDLFTHFHSIIFFDYAHFHFIIFFDYAQLI